MSSEVAIAGSADYRIEAAMKRRIPLPQNLPKWDISGQPAFLTDLRRETTESGLSASLHANFAPRHSVDYAFVAKSRLSDIRTSPILGRLIAKTDKITVDGEADKFKQERS